jgi:cytochrome d ubiquinol oxidase subunit II
MGYAILDGFDMGVGILHPLARTNRERRMFVNSIGPLWDGNEVWLVTLGGALFAVAVFPNIVTANNNPAHSLTIYNAASSPKTLGIGLLIVVIGLPFVLTYTAVIYWTFRGKVVVGKDSY